MKYLCLVLSAVAIVSCKAQDVTDAINRDVWAPFMESYGALNTDAFMALHTPDVIRVSRDGKQILLGSEYAESVGAGNTRSKERGERRTISFSFTDRLHNDHIAYEVGYYRIRSAMGGQERLFYGKFHVVLKKMGNTWKIAVDSDSSHGQTITEEMFMSGEVLDLPID